MRKKMFWPDSSRRTCYGSFLYEIYYFYCGKEIFIAWQRRDKYQDRINGKIIHYAETDIYIQRTSIALLFRFESL
jgi:hypothetical protein